MKKLTITACAIAMTLKLLTGWAQLPSLSSLGGSAFQMLGGSQAVSSMAGNFVGSAMQDPRLASLLKGKNVDPAAVSAKVSDELCALLGGGCKAPLTNSQVASAASKLTPTQSKAITDNFNSALSKAASDPLVSQAVTQAVGNKIPGVLAGLL
ncbi:MAG TPA: hypothetical protein VEG26_00320 [Steroidobacteraceae bacterium]|nr:hypothetical protein [Steroidobacteraceae bacterium]